MVATLRNVGNVKSYDDDFFERKKVVFALKRNRKCSESNGRLQLYKSLNNVK